MDSQRSPEVETLAKVLPFPPRSTRRAKASDLIKAEQARALERRRRQTAVWTGRAWVVLAWIVAACRLRLAIVHREVFGFEASVALLVAIVLPLMRAPSIAATIRETVAAVRRASRARRNGGSAEPGAHPPASPPRRVGRSVQ
jgi:hypothetical protein